MPKRSQSAVSKSPATCDETKPAKKQRLQSKKSDSESIPKHEINVKSPTLDMSKVKLRVSIDYGTKTLAAAYTIVRPDQQHSPLHIHNAVFGAEHYAPQQAAWDSKGTFHWGWDVDGALDDWLIRPSQIVELLKLLLYKEHATSVIAKRVLRQLGDHTVDEYLATHLREIIKAVKKSVKRNVTIKADFNEREVEQMPLELLLSVPQMWKAPANRHMTTAAKCAGIEHVELVYEPQCAAAFYTYTVKDKMPRQMKAGDVLLVADIGGGTGDFVSYRLESGSDDGAAVQLCVAKDAKGALCGSEWVTQAMLAWLNDNAEEGWQAMCKYLNITDAEARRSASIAFEVTKQDFTLRKKDPAYITLRGQLPNGQKRRREFEISCEEIATFFEPVFQRIFRCIEEQMLDETKAMIVPGGFGRSPYLRDRLAKKFPKLEILDQLEDAQGARQSVTKGALYRYKSIRQGTLDPLGSFGIGQDEEWNPSLHPDATIFPEREPDPDLVEYHRIYTDSPTVYERWLPLLSAVQQGNHNSKPISTTAWQQTHPDVADDHMTLQIYWTDRAIAAHDPILTHKHLRVPGCRLRDGIEPWGAPLVFELQDLKGMGYKLHKLKNKQRDEVFELYYRVKLECDGANVRVNWQVLKPGVRLVNDEGVLREPKGGLSKNQIYEIVAASHNPMPRTQPDL
ncbi:hypothetical protein LTR86_001102 [Recurvomyces mirabilis]|nr:hypothetical protein LTR86_001102 [Recurvomyces mirabilis]